MTLTWFGHTDSQSGYGYFGLCYSPWHSKDFPMAWIQGDGDDLASVVEQAGQFVVEGIETEEKRWVDIYLADEDGRVHSGEYDVIRVGIRPLDPPK